MANFGIKRNDLAPPLIVTLQKAGLAYNLSAGGTTVKFGMQSQGAPVKVNAAATILDAVNGIVEYVWAPGDTDTPGIFAAEFQVTGPDAKPITFPNDDYLTVTVLADIANP